MRRPRRRPPRRVRAPRTAARRSSSCIPRSGGGASAPRCWTGSSSWPAPAPLSVWAHGDLPGSAELLAPRGFTRARVLLQMRRDLAGRRPRPAARAARRRARAAVPARPRRGRLAARERPRVRRAPRAGQLDPRGPPAAGGRAVVRPRGVPARLARRPGRRRRPAGLALDEGAPGRGTSPTSRSARSTCWASTPTPRGCASGAPSPTSVWRTCAARGLGQVLLYVEEDNEAAVRLYEGRGFSRFAVDVSWRREPR